MIVWVDLETTGLIPAKERILEVAAIITDDDLVEVARFHSVTSEARYHDLSQVDPYVLKMHADNGLWCESLLAQEFGEIGRVDEALRFFIEEHCGENIYEKKGPQLAGSTISFDRAFMQVHLPTAHALLHYRNLDVSTLNEMSKRFWPEVYESRPRQNADGGRSAHRAMSDIEHSLWTARYYASRLGPVNLDDAVAG